MIGVISKHQHNKTFQGSQNKGSGGGGVKVVLVVVVVLVVRRW